MNVVIDTDKGIVGITGFCCIQESLEPPEPVRQQMPLILPGIHYNSSLMWESMLRLKEASNIVVAIHDPKWCTVDRIP